MPISALIERKEAWDVLVDGRFLSLRNRQAVIVFTPQVDGLGNLLDVLFGQVAVDPRLHKAHLAGINEQHLPRSVPTVLALVLGKEPDAARNLRVQEELTGQSHDALDHIVFDHLLADGVLPA